MTLEKQNLIEKKESLEEKVKRLTNLFLGEEISFLDEEKILEIRNKVEEKINFKKDPSGGLDLKNIVNYDKHAKKFKNENGENISKGDIVNAIRMGLGIDLSFKNKASLSLEEKKLEEIVNEAEIRKVLFQELNYELARVLAEKESTKDLLKQNAYLKIKERSLIESKQFGVRAEQIIIGAIEKIITDRPDLKINIIEANAYQDVNNKIDFIISTIEQKRGIGVNREDLDNKVIGIQFTINTNKEEFKKEQILKSKERGINIDDIIYIEIDPKILRSAIEKAENNKNVFTGPWKFLDDKTKEELIKNLFSGLLKEEQIQSILKNNF